MYNYVKNSFDKIQRQYVRIRVVEALFYRGKAVQINKVRYVSEEFYGQVFNFLITSVRTVATTTASNTFQGRMCLTI